MHQFPVLIKHRRSGTAAWGMKLLADNVEDFGSFVPSFRQSTKDDPRPISPIFVVDEGSCTMRYGDVIILNHATQGVVGVCDGAVFSSYWELDNLDGLIPMPIRAANEEDEVRPTGEIHTDEVTLMDLITNTIRGEFHDFEDRFETALAGKQNVGERAVSDEVAIELRKWVLLWVERNMREETVLDKMKAANMLTKFVTSGNYEKYWMVGQ